MRNKQNTGYLFNLEKPTNRVGIFASEVEFSTFDQGTSPLTVILQHPPILLSHSLWFQASLRSQQCSMKFLPHILHQCCFLYPWSFSTFTHADFPSIAINVPTSCYVLIVQALSTFTNAAFQLLFHFQRSPIAVSLFWGLSRSVGQHATSSKRVFNTDNGFINLGKVTEDGMATSVFQRYPATICDNIKLKDRVMHTNRNMDRNVNYL